MRIPKYFHSKYFILSRRDTAIVNYQKLPFPDQGISETAKSAPGLYPEADSFRQHRTMGTAGFGGSFAPIVQYEKWEIHPVFPHFSYFRLCQNLSPNLLAPLCGAALGVAGLNCPFYLFDNLKRETEKSVSLSVFA